MLALDEHTGELGLREVNGTRIREGQPVLELELVGQDISESLIVTAEHPFWTGDRGWIPAGDLEPGESIYTSSGEWIEVGASTWQAQSETVYNLDVEEADTFFVGELGAWVHNYPPPPSGGAVSSTPRFISNPPAARSTSRPFKG